MARFVKKYNKTIMPKKQISGLSLFTMNVQKSAVRFFTHLGSHVFHLGRYAFYRVLKLCKNAGKGLFKLISSAFLKTAGCIKAFFGRKISNIGLHFRNQSAAFSAQKKKSGMFIAVGLYIKTALKSLWARKKYVITVFNYVAPVLAVVFLYNVIHFGSGVKYGITVEYNGQVIGIVNNEAEVNVAQQEMQDRIVYVDGDQQIKVNTSYSVQKLSATDQVSSSNELADKMINNSDVPVIQAYGFYVNGEFKGAVKDKEAIQSTLDGILAKYKTGTAGETVEFVDKYELKDGSYLESGLIDPETVVATLTAQKKVAAYYTIVAGDAPTSIAQKVGISYSELKALNPKIESNCMIGNKVLLNRSEPSVSVRVTRTETYTTKQPFKTVSVNDSSKYKGTKTVLVEGVQGTAKVTANVSYINGYETDREVTSTQILTKPVDQKVSIGTKSTGASAYMIRNSGQFMWPVAGGYISCGFRGYSGHNGVDIAASRGTPIYAADDGVVASASSGYNGGLGNVVKINHGDGWQTVYGHTSKILVKAGQRVQKGDLIALVGSTGRSTGNHCHFEVKRYNTNYNPALYI